MSFSPYDIISSEENPHYLPIPDPRYTDIGEITQGDSHANFMVELGKGHFHGIFNFTKEVWDQLHEILYKTYEDPTGSTITTDDCYYFYQAVSAAINRNQVHILWRFMGDGFADRNGCDIFRLLLLKILHENKIPYTEVLSNHTYELIYDYEMRKLNPDHKFKGCYMEGTHQINSLRALQNIIDRDILKQKDPNTGNLIHTSTIVDNLIETYLLPHLKCMDWSINSRNEFTFYSHAPAGNTRFAEVAQSLGGVNYTNFSIDDIDARLAALHELEEKFESIRNAHEIHKYMSSPGHTTDTPLTKLVWNRKYNLDFSPNVKYVHGHDHKMENPASNVETLDTEFGKWREVDGQFPFKISKSIYTHDSVVQNSWIFQADYDALPKQGPDILRRHIKPEKINALLAAFFDKNKLYSKFHFIGLNILLNSYRTDAIFEQFDKSQHLRSDNFINKIAHNLDFREVFFLLLQLVEDKDLFIYLEPLLSYDDRELKIIFKTLLLLLENPTLNTDTNLAYILTFKGNRENAYEELVKVRHYENLTADSMLASLIIGELNASPKAKRLSEEVKNQIPYLELNSARIDPDKYIEIQDNFWDNVILPITQSKDFSSSDDGIDEITSLNELSELERENFISDIQSQLVNGLDINDFNEEQLIRIYNSQNLSVYASIFDEECYQVISEFCIDSLSVIFEDISEPYKHLLISEIKQLGEVENALTLLDLLEFCKDYGLENNIKFDQEALENLIDSVFMQACINAWEFVKESEDPQKYFELIFLNDNLQSKVLWLNFLIEQDCEEDKYIHLGVLLSQNLASNIALFSNLLQTLSAIKENLDEVLNILVHLPKDRINDETITQFLRLYNKNPDIEIIKAHLTFAASISKQSLFSTNIPKVLDIKEEDKENYSDPSISG